MAGKNEHWKQAGLIIQMPAWDPEGVNLDLRKHRCPGDAGLSEHWLSLDVLRIISKGKLALWERCQE